MTKTYFKKWVLSLAPNYHADSFEDYLTEYSLQLQEYFVGLCDGIYDSMPEYIEKLAWAAEEKTIYGIADRWYKTSMVLTAMDRLIFATMRNQVYAIYKSL